MLLKIETAVLYKKGAFRFFFVPKTFIKLKRDIDVVINNT